MIKLRQVTSFMLDILMDCHEREILGQPPTAYRTQHVKGLVCREYVNDVLITNNSNGKKELVFVISDQGKAFLDKKFKNA